MVFVCVGFESASRVRASEPGTTPRLAIATGVSCLLPARRIRARRPKGQRTARNATDARMSRVGGQCLSVALHFSYEVNANPREVGDKILDSEFTISAEWADELVWS